MTTIGDAERAMFGEPGEPLDYCEVCGGYRAATHRCERPCYGLSSVNPHPLGSRAADCPECPHPCSGGRCPDPEAHAEGAHDL